MSKSKNFYDSWFVRIIVALVSLMISFLAFVLAFYTLWCNEEGAVHRAKTLDEGEAIVISIDPIYINSFNNDQLVHVTYETFTNDFLTDEIFNLSVFQTIKLRRTAEMYQWKEVRYDSDSGPSYSYKKVWSKRFIDSRRFHRRGHRNPPSMPVQGQTWVAEKVKLGELTLSSSLVAKMNHYQLLSITDGMVMQMPYTLLYNRNLHFNKGNYYLGNNPNSPQIGDLRVKFEVVYPEAISVVAKQAGSHLFPYRTRQADSLSHLSCYQFAEKIGYIGLPKYDKEAGDIELLEYGTVDAETMFLYARIYNFAKKLPQRIVGFFIMFVGIYMAFVVLGRLETFMPFVSGIVEWSRGWISLAIVAATVSLFTIALFWIDYMPMLAIIFMVIAVSFLGLLKFARQLQEVPKLESPEPTLVHDRIVPQKII